MKLLVVVTTLALIASTAVYTATFFGVDVHRALPNIWLLHLGMFAVLVLTALLLPKKRNEREFRMRDLLDGYPLALRWLTAALVVFCSVNVAAFEKVCGPGGPLDRARRIVRDHKPRAGDPADYCERISKRSRI